MIVINDKFSLKLYARFDIPPNPKYYGKVISEGVYLDFDKNFIRLDNITDFDMKGLYTDTFLYRKPNTSTDILYPVSVPKLTLDEIFNADLKTLPQYVSLNADVIKVYDDSVIYVKDNMIYVYKNGIHTCLNITFEDKRRNRYRFININNISYHCFETYKNVYIYDLNYNLIKKFESPEGYHVTSVCVSSCTIETLNDDGYRHNGHRQFFYTFYDKSVSNVPDITFERIDAKNIYEQYIINNVCFRHEKYGYYKDINKYVSDSTCLYFSCLTHHIIDGKLYYFDNEKLLSDYFALYEVILTKNDVDIDLAIDRKMTDNIKKLNNTV